jgi:hypothetical protein
MKHLEDKRIFFLVCVNAALFVPVVVLDAVKAAASVTPAQGRLCDILKYAAIASCLLICIFAWARARKPGAPQGEAPDPLFRAARIQTIVFCLTLAADFFLLFTPFAEAGLFIFFGAHMAALIRYKPKWAIPVGIFAAAAFCAALIAAPRLFRMDAPFSLFLAACSCYVVLIASVTASALFAKQPRANALCSRLGMLLFLACDVNVAIFNAGEPGHPPHTAAIVLMWLFYLPAQTLLALSACKWYTKAL